MWIKCYTTITLVFCSYLIYFILLSIQVVTVMAGNTIWQFYILCQKQTDEELVCPLLNPVTRHWEGAYTEITKIIGQFKAAAPHPDPQIMPSGLQCIIRFTGHQHWIISSYSWSWTHTYLVCSDRIIQSKVITYSIFHISGRGVRHPHPHQNPLLMRLLDTSNQNCYIDNYLQIGTNTETVASIWNGKTISHMQGTPLLPFF